MDNERSVIVVDDHEIIGKGCQVAFQEAGVPWNVRYCDGLRDVAKGVGKTVVVLDLRLKDGSTPSQNIKALARRNVPVVVYTSAENPVLVREAIRAGALAVIRKSGSPKELVDAVAAAFEGVPTATLDWAAAVDADDDFVVQHLTPTEARVLACYANGAKSERVGRMLGLSANTVNTYVARIRDKYRAAGRPADNRVDLFRRAAEDGLVSYWEQ